MYTYSHNLKTALKISLCADFQLILLSSQIPSIVTLNDGLPRKAGYEASHDLKMGKLKLFCVNITQLPTFRIQNTL